MNNKTKLNIAILFGGISPEHEVSIITGIQIVKAIDKFKYNPIPIYISKSGEWYRLDSQKIEVKHFKDISSITVNNPRVVLTSDPTLKGIIRLQPNQKIHLGKQSEEEIDVFFPAFHGNNGEDGSIQGLLKLTDSAFVGCNVQSSAIGIDKIIFGSTNFQQRYW